MKEAKALGSRFDNGIGTGSRLLVSGSRTLLTRSDCNKYASLKPS